MSKASLNSSDSELHIIIPDSSAHSREWRCSITRAPYRGFFMCGGESGFDANPCSKKSPGAIFHDRREPAGRGAWTRRIQISLEL